MKQASADVALFHHLTDTPVLTVPVFPDIERIRLREDLIDEEVNRELMKALMRRDMVGVADGVIDGIYVLIGLGHEFGLPLEALWNEVQRANASKAVEQPDGTYKIVRREDGKVLKPEGWTPPDIEGVLRAHGWQGTDALMGIGERVAVTP